MGKIKIEFNDEAFKQILTSDGTKHELAEQAKAIRDRANANAGYEDYIYTMAQGKSRWFAFVNSKGKWGAIEEAKNKSLSRAIK